MKHTLLSLIALLPALTPAQTPREPVTTYRVSTLAGVPWHRSAPGQAPDVMVGSPHGVARDSKGNLYVSSRDHNLIRKIAPDGSVTTAIDFYGPPFNQFGVPIDRKPTYLAVSPDDKTLYFVESGTNIISRWELATGDGGSIVTGAEAGIPMGIAVDAQDNLYFADNRGRVRRRSPAGIFTTLAGTGGPVLTGDAGALTQVTSVAIHPTNGDLYFADNYNRIRRLRGTVLTQVAGSATAAATVREGPALATSIVGVAQLAFDRDGQNLYFSATAPVASHLLRKLNLADGRITLVAGVPPGTFSPDGQPAVQSGLANPQQIVIEEQGAVVFADTGSQRIRRIGADGILRRVLGLAKFSIEGGTIAPDVAVFDRPGSLRLDSRGALVVADTGNCLIRNVIPTQVSIAAGVQGFCGIASDIESAVIDNNRNVFWMTPRGLYRRAPGDPAAGTLRGGPPGWSMTLAPDGNSLYFLGGLNGGAIYNVALTNALAATPLMAVLTHGGRSAGFEDGGQFTAKFNSPNALAFLSNGDLLVAEAQNRAIRRIKGPETTTYAKVNLLPFLLAADSADRVWTGVLNQLVRIDAQGNFVEVIGGLQRGLSPNGATYSAVQIGRVISPVGGRNGVIYFIDGDYNVIRQAVPVTIDRLEMLDGNNQSAAAGSALPAPLRVRVLGGDGLPLSGVPVVFKADGLTFPPSILTGLDGVASVPVTLPAAVGSITVTATSLNLPPVNFTVTSLGAAPVLTSARVAAAFGGGTRIASGSWLELTGTDLASAQGVAPEGEAPVTLGGTRVLLNGSPALLRSVSPAAIECVVPDGLAEGPVEVVVVSEAGRSAALTLEGVARAPALQVVLPAPESGKALVWARINEAEATLAGPEGAGMRPVKPGEKITLVGTGFGAAPEGVEIRLGDVTATVESVTGGLFGVFRIVVTVPELPAGESSLTATVNGVPVAREMWTVVG